MILDERNEFADALSVAAAVGTTLIGDVIDLGAVRNIANGRPVYLVISTAVEIVTAGAAGTIAFVLASDAQAAIAVDGSATEHFRTKAYVTDDSAVNDAALNVGGQIAAIALPLEGPTYEKYLGILRVIGGADVTAGAINAFLTFTPRQWKAVADGVS